MKKQFQKVGDLRLKLSSIKKYRDFSKLEIAVNFTSSVTVYETETVKFKSESLKKECLKQLDLMFEHDFLTVEDIRIKLSTIKKYKPLNGVKMVLYYSTNRSTVVSDTFGFNTTRKRDDFINNLDLKFGVN